MITFLRIALSATFAGMLATAYPAAAMQLTPIEMDFTTSGRGTTQTFRLENNTRDPVAAEITIKSRKMSLQGVDVLSDAEDDFTVFPAQLVLQPGQVQSVRVQWLGKSAPKSELAYRLIAEQLPIDVGKPQAQGGAVRLLVRYIASLYVVPAGARSQLTVKNAERINIASTPRLRVTLENNGTTRQVVRDVNLRITGPGQSNVILKDQQLQGLIGENILAGHARQFDLAWPQQLADGPLTAVIEPARP